MNAIRKASQERAFISLYFQNGNIGHRKKRDFTLSFNKCDPLYEKCKKLSSMRIKEIIGVLSYRELKEIAKKENRSLSNYAKSKLIRYFEEDE
jgi:hypothetical protein